MKLVVARTEGPRQSRCKALASRWLCRARRDCFVVALLATTSGALAEEARYTAEEIESLVNKHAYADAMLHLPEVATADRGKSWDSLVEKVAVGYLSSIAEEDPSNAMTMADRLPESHPSLGRSPKYRETVETIAYVGFKRCFAQKEGREACAKNLKEHVSRRLTSAERPASRFCRDEKMSASLGELCAARKANPKGKRAKP